MRVSWLGRQAHMYLANHAKFLFPLRAALVLVNSAGKIVPDYTSPPEDASVNGKAGPPALVADVVSWGIFNFLERSIAK